jgi:hypothetical protein
VSQNALKGRNGANATIAVDTAIANTTVPPSLIYLQKRRIKEEILILVAVVLAGMPIVTPAEDVTDAVNAQKKVTPKQLSRNVPITIVYVKKSQNRPRIILHLHRKSLMLLPFDRTRMK